MQNELLLSGIGYADFDRITLTRMRELIQYQQKIRDRAVLDHALGDLASRSSELYEKLVKRYEENEMGERR